MDQDYDDLTNDGTQDQGVFLVEYASGKGAEQYPEDSGKLLPADKKARVSYHLHSIGEDVQAGIELGIVFHPKGTVPEHVRWSKQLARHNTDLDIPAGMVVRQDGYERLNMAARLTAFQPHMHILGKYQCLELIYPTTPITSEVVSCANFDYNWHLVYNYADDVAPLVPAGTILHTISWHDNTEANRVNPGSDELDRERRPHDRRDGLRVDRLVRPDRRGVRAGAGGTEGAAGCDRQQRIVASRRGRRRAASRERCRVVSPVAFLLLLVLSARR